MCEGLSSTVWTVCTKEKTPTKRRRKVIEGDEIRFVDGLKDNNRVTEYMLMKNQGVDANGTYLLFLSSKDR